MVIRQIKESRWEHVHRQIIAYGRAAPLSLQFDIDVRCNGLDYILKIQPEPDRKLIALQALGVYPDGETGEKDYHLIKHNGILSALLELVIYQGMGNRK
jgi:hypothetical protein